MSAFLESQISIEDIVRENDKIVSRFAISGNLKGTMMGMGIPPTISHVAYNKKSAYHITGNLNENVPLPS